MRDSVRAVFLRMADGLRTSAEVDPAVFEDFAVAQVEADIPLADVQSALWIGFQIDWDLMLPAMRRLNIPIADQQQAGRLIWDLGRRMNMAVVETYRRESAARAVDRSRRDSACVQALIQDNAVDPGSRFDALTSLGFSPSGEICVVVASVTVLGTSPLPRVDRHLGAVPIVSAWHLDVEHIVGLVSAASRYELDHLRRIAASFAPTRVGISVPVPPAHLSRAWRLAWLALRSTSPQQPVTVFGDDPTGNLIAATAPDVLEEFNRRTLAGLEGLSDTAREQLIETFVAWLDCDGSVPLTAGRVFRHANTVRYRLRKLEELTGRSLSHPNDVTELALAVRVAGHSGDPFAAGR